MLRLGIDPEKLYRATFICQDGLCFCNMALISFRLFRKNLGNLRDFFGQMVYRPPPPWQKIPRTPMDTVPTWVAHSFQKHTQSFHTVEHSPLLTVESGRQLQCFSKARKVGFFNVELCFTFGHSAESMLSRLNGSYCW